MHRNIGRGTESQIGAGVEVFAPAPLKKKLNETHPPNFFRIWKSEKKTLDY